MRMHLILAATVLLGATPALAAGDTWQVGNDSYHVYLDDLDLNTQAGRAQALARVEKAADKLCANAGVRAEIKACRADVVAAVSGTARGALRMALAERSKAPMNLARAK